VAAKKAESVVSELCTVSAVRVGRDVTKNFRGSDGWVISFRGQIAQLVNARTPSTYYVPLAQIAWWRVESSE
jgi:hypothetical protein